MSRTKRFVDILFSGTLVITTFWWLGPILSMAVKLDSQGPFLIKQKRQGRFENEFWCYKIRTLKNDSAAPNPEDEKNLPVTFIGNLLRCTGLDELPQLLNVLRGEMSIVGPRPHLAVYNVHYSKFVGAEKIKARHQVLPGLTGLAQVRGYKGPAEKPEDIQLRIDSDLEYIEKQSLGLDFHIIVQSALLVLKAFFK